MDPSLTLGMADSDPDVIVEGLASLCCKIIAAQRCFFLVVGEGEGVQCDPDEPADAKELVGEALREKAPVAGFRAAPEGNGIAAVCLPLLNQRKVIGLLYLEAFSQSAISSEIIAQLEKICSYAAIVLGLSITAGRLKQTQESAGVVERDIRIALDMPSALTRQASIDRIFEIGNGPSHEYTGLSVEDAEGHGYMRAFHPDDLYKVMSTLNRLVEQGVAGEVEARMLRFDGVTKSFLLRAVPLRNHAGEIVTCYGTNTNIEDLQSAKDELSRSRDILLEGERVSHIGSWSWNAASDVITWSEQCARIFGFGDDSAPVSFEALLERVHPEDQALVIEFHQKAMHGAGDFSMEHRILWPDGEILLVESRGRIIRDSIGSMIEYIGTTRDITESKFAQERIQESEQRYAATLSSIGDAVIATDRNGNITFINPVAERLTGWSQPEAAGRPARDIFRVVTEEDGETTGDPVAELLKRDGKAVIDTRTMLKSRDDRVFPVDHSGAPIIDGRGEMAGAVLVFRDVTQRIETIEALRKLREDLARMNRLTVIGELTVSIAHEMNQPLMAIVTNAAACINWLESAEPDLEQARRAVGWIIREGHRAGEVLSSIRALAKNAPPNIRPLDLDEIIREVLQLVRSDLRRQSISVETVFGGGPPAMGDRIQLQQVLLNLIMNGADAMSENREWPRQLHIATRLGEPGFIQVDITDHGAGLDSANIDRIFEPFFTTKPTGIGMGLSICRSIVEAHGGRLWATSTSPRGSTFSFLIPMPSVGSGGT